MNKKQKAVILIGVVIILVMGIFPPWIYVYHRAVSMSGKGVDIFSEKSAGYVLVFKPPPPEKESEPYGIRLDSNRLLAQWAMVILAVIGLTLVFQKRKED